MNRRVNRNTIWAAVIAAAATLALVQPALSQGPPPQMPQMSPAAQAKMKAWQKFRDSHKNYNALRRTLGAFAEMEKDPKTKLTPAQAKSILAVLTAWRKKPTMTDAQALAVNKKLTAGLSTAQIKKIAMSRERGGRRGGPGGGGPGGSGGFGGGRPGGGPGGGRFDPSKMPAPKEYNPLNPATNPMTFRREMEAKRLDGLIAALKARAAGKK